MVFFLALVSEVFFSVRYFLHQRVCLEEMDKSRNIPLSKEGEEGITADDDEVTGVEVFQKTLVSKLWTENSFNSRAFISTITGA